MGCSSPGSSVYEILWARTLEWIAISFSSSSIDALYFQFEDIDYEQKGKKDLNLFLRETDLNVKGAAVDYWGGTIPHSVSAFQNVRAPWPRVS